MNISLIGVPVKYGADREGVQYGPEKLREKGLIDVVKRYKENVYDLGNLYIPEVLEENKYAHNRKIKYFKEIVDMNTNLAHLVYSCLKADSFPFIFGGDHSLGLGSIAGASKYFKNIGVIWIDAHGDINTEDTSPSGNAHGIPLGAALGYGNPALVNLYYPGPKVKPENTFIIGARDLDEGEIQLAERIDLKIYTMDIVKKQGLKSVIDEVITKLKASNVDAFHLSFDIDVLDKKLVPGTGTPVDGGFTLEEAKDLLKAFLETKMVRSMDFVELNPLLDEKDSTAKLCIELIDWLFKYIWLAKTIKYIY